MAKRKNPKIDIVIFGSSHVTPYHHLPHYLEIYFTDHDKFELPVIFGEGGAKITEDVVKFIDLLKKKNHILTGSD